MASYLAKVTYNYVVEGQDEVEALKNIGDFQRSLDTHDYVVVRRMREDKLIAPESAEIEIVQRWEN